MLAMVGIAMAVAAPQARTAALPPTPTTSVTLATPPTSAVAADEPDTFAESAPAIPAEAVTTTTAPMMVPPKPWKVMLIGDSMAFTAGLGLSSHASAYEFVVANEGINGCGVVRGGPYRYFGAQRTMEQRCELWPSAWADALRRNEPHLVAIVVGRWELMDRVWNGRWTNLFDPEFAAYIDSEIDSAVVLAGSTGARVTLFSAPYFRRGTTADGGLFPEDDPARVDAVNGIIRAVAARYNVPVIEVGAFLSPNGGYARDVHGVRVRSDGVHLTRQAGDLLAPWLFPQLQQVMVSPLPALPEDAGAGVPAA